MKAVVVYRSRSGFVKKYAEWIAEELQSELFEASSITPDRLLDYDTVIYGGGLYEAGINGVKLITRNMEKLKGKKLVVFGTGASPARQKDLDTVIGHNFTEEHQKYIRFFYLRGGFDYSKLKRRDKILMTFLKWKLARKKDLSADERGMFNAYEKPVDFTKRKNIDELIAYVRQ